MGNVKANTTTYCYYNLQYALVNFLKLCRNKRFETGKSEADKMNELKVSAELQTLVAAQYPHPSKNFDKEYIVDNLGMWMSKVLHPIDAVRIAKEHF